MKKRPGQLAKVLGLSVASLLALGFARGAAGAPDKRSLVPDAPPEIVHTATGTVEVGILAGAAYRIDVPAAWNHALVVYFHGYSESLYTYRVHGPLNEQTQPLFDRGYAVIQSGYSTSGWALAEGYPETEQLRLYFLKQYAPAPESRPVEGRVAQGKGQSIETIAAGGSMGGALVVAELELNPRPYAGGLALCGSVGPADLAFQRRFAWRAAFDFYFPGLLPQLVPAAPDFQESPGLRMRVLQALRGNPEAASALRGLTGAHADRELADNMVYFTFVLADMQRRAGGNPFDNRNFLYTGTSPASTGTDNALNDGVRRYPGDPRARAYLLAHYTPSGRLSHPLLALHTTYDPRIPGSTLALYAEQVAIAGESQNLVQQYVHRDGHCAFTSEEVGRTFDELVNWLHTGRRPSPGLLPAAPAVTAGR